MKLLLLRPKSNNPEYKKTEVFCYPIELASIATYVSRKIPSAQIEVYDEETRELDLEKTLRDVDYIGVTSYYGSHSNGLRILSSAKTIYPKIKTIIGGPNTSYLGKRMMRNNPFIDYVINVSCAEESVTDLLMGKKKSNIPGLYYRENGCIKFSFKKTRFDIDEYVYDLDNIKYKNDIVMKNRFPVRSIMGCIKSVLCKERCIFCSIPFKGIHLKSPDRFWEQIGLLYKKYGIKRFYEAGDCFLIGTYPRKILKNKPSYLKDVRIRVFETPANMTDENVKLLNRIGVDSIFIGIESGSDSMLKVMGKIHAKEDVIKALDNCRKNNIRIVFPLVFGCPGESEETLNETYEFAIEILNKYEDIIEYRIFSLMVPIAGSEIFEMCRKNQNIIRAYNTNGRDIDRDDVIDYDLLQRLTIKEFCTVSLERINDVIGKLYAHTNDKRTLFWKT
jgi:radical SAM superfamily enzyme YgiQ (UPF0313 family)